MIAAVDILGEVEAGVVALNGEIVRRAFHGTCCNFFANQDEFRSLLAQYIWHRMKVRRLEISEKIWWQSGCSLVLEPRHYETLFKNKCEAENSRTQLSRIWPCAACIWVFNPTGRTKRFPQLA